MQRDIRDRIAQKFIAVFMLGIGLLFVYVPGVNFLESQSKKKVMTDGQLADIDSITKHSDHSAVSEAVSRLITRNDVARVHVLKGDIEYPEFQIKRGKNTKPGDIGFWVDARQNGYSVWIGYSMTNAASERMERDFKESIMAMGSFLFGSCMIMFGLMGVFIPAKDLMQRRMEENPPPTPVKLDPPKPEPVSYGGLKIVK